MKFVERLNAWVEASSWNGFVFMETGFAGAFLFLFSIARGAVSYSLLLTGWVTMSVLSAPLPWLLPRFFPDTSFADLPLDRLFTMRRTEEGVYVLESHEGRRLVAYGETPDAVVAKMARSLSKETA